MLRARKSSFNAVVLSVTHTGSNSATWLFNASVNFGLPVPTGFQVSADGITWQDVASGGAYTGTSPILGYSFGVNPAAGWQWRLLASYTGETVPLQAPASGTIL